MDDYNSKPSKKVLIVARILMILLIYSSAVIADFVGRFIASKQSITTLMGYRNFKKAEFEREVLEDTPYAKIARAEGYKSMLFPTLYDREGWTDLANAYQIAPLAPQPNSDLYFCNEGYGLIKYHSDRFGFRNNDTLWEEKTVDVVIVGDSFGQGACVSFGQSIGGLLSKESMKVINLSSFGNSPIHYASILKVFGSKIRTRYLMLLFYANDNMDNEEKSIFNQFYIKKTDTKYFNNPSASLEKLELSEGLQRLYSDSEKRIETSIAIEPHVDPTIEIDRNIAEIKQNGSKLDFALVNIRGRLAALLQMATANELPYSSKLAIETAVDVCDKNSCEVLFFYIPNNDYRRPDARAKVYASQLRDYVNFFGKRFTDLGPELAPLGDSAYAKVGPHLSPEGYAVVAKSVKAQIN